MNLQPTPWHHHSHVAVCPDCAGTGVIHSHRQPTVADPYPESPCDCGLGEHEPECPVCGFNLVVDGYDCLACDTVREFNASQLRRFDADAFAAALKVAVFAALDASERFGEAR